MSDTDKIAETLGRWQRVALLVTVAGCALCGLAYTLDLQQLLRSYLVGFLYWWSVSVGCLGILMLYFLVGGRWGFAVKPLLQCGSMTMPLVALLFFPIAMNLEQIYPWVGGDTITPQKAQYLNPQFFYGRAVGYFVLWMGLALLLRGPIATTTAERPRWRRLVSAGGLVLLVLTVTFASIDWAMSLDPAWFSSIYGALVAIGGALSGLTLVTLTVAALDGRQLPAARHVPAKTLGDLGSLMLAFLMLWAYFAFSQFLIIWSGNLPEENFWYVYRFQGGWQWLGLAIVVLQFFLPFFLLLSRDLKQNPRSLAKVAVLILVMQYLNILWTLVPSFHPEQLTLHWVDFAVPLAIGGLWVSFFLWLLRRRIPQLLAEDPT